MCSVKVSVDDSPIAVRYSTARGRVWFPGLQTQLTEIVNDCIIVWNNLISGLGSFQIKVLDTFYQPQSTTLFPQIIIQG